MCIRDRDNTLGIDWVGQNWATRNINNWGNISNYNALYQRVLGIPEYKMKMQLLLKKVLEQMTSNNFINRSLNIKNQLFNHVKNDIFYTYDYGYDTNDFWQSWTSAAGGHVDFGINPYIANRNSSAMSQFLSGNSKPVLLSGVISGKSNEGPLTISIDALDESSLSQVIFNYRNIGNSTWTTLALLDNGSIPDKNAGDGTFSGAFQPDQTCNGIEYYWTALDIQGQTARYPCSFFSHSLHSKPPVVINELMSRNSNNLSDQNGDFSDWIELYNPTGSSIDLTNIFISDKISNPERFHLKSNTLPSQGYLLLWASGDTSQYNNHLPFRLSGNGETLYLSYREANGTFKTLDKIKFPASITNQSYGRMYDGNNRWVTFQNYPTPNANNSGILSFYKEKVLIPPFPYPNPHIDFFIYKNTLDEPSEISLHNQLGQLIYHAKIGKNQEIRIENNGLSGLYILTARYSSQTLKFKLNKL